MVDFGAKMAHLLNPQYLVSGQKGPHPFDKRWSWTGNSEVTSIGAGEKVDGLGECGGKEVEYVGYIHYTGALRNTYSSMNGVGEVILWTIF